MRAHGLARTYYDGCRCDLCRDGARRYKSDQRAKAKAQLGPRIQRRGSGFTYDPPEGHGLKDILIDPTEARQSLCECRWFSGWWGDARLAVDEWRSHVGVDG